MGALRDSRRLQAALAFVLVAAVAGVALLMHSRLDSTRPPLVGADAGTPPEPLLELSQIPVRSIPGLSSVEGERHPGPQARALLLGKRVHACGFDDQLTAMSCSVIEHTPQYGPHGEPDVEFADTEPGAPAWVEVPGRAGTKVRKVANLYFELRPDARVVAHDLWIDAFIGADRRLAVIQIGMEQDVLVYGAAGGDLKRLKLPAPSGATQLVGQWLLWPGGGKQLHLARASSDGLAAVQTLTGSYAGVACHGPQGTRMLGDNDSKLLLFTETNGRWSTISGIDLRLSPLPTTDPHRFEPELTTLTCTKGETIVFAYRARRLDQRRSEIESCAQPGACHYLLELGIARCSGQRCASEPRRSVDLGSGGLLGKPKVLPTRDGVLVLWMTHQGSLRMKWIRPNRDAPVREVVRTPSGYLAAGWSSGDFAVALLTERERGVRALRFGPSDHDVAAVGQR